MAAKVYLLFLIGMLIFMAGCEYTAASLPMIICPSCELEPEAGPCRAAIPKYYFDKDEKKCKEFTWGGCEGVVPFETLEDCEACDCNN